MGSRAEAILLLGPTGSGKSPLGDLIAGKGVNGRQFHHFDFGNELRRVASGSAPADTFPDGERDFIRSVLEQGVLLEDRHFPLARKIFLSFRDRTGFSKGDSVMLNGLPRHEGQARDMENLVKVSGVVFLECSAEVIYERIRLDTGGDRAERDDDAFHMVEKKLDLFHSRTEPLIQHYRENGSWILSLDVHAGSTPGETYEKFVAESGRL